MLQFLKHHKATTVLLLSALALHWSFAYQLERTDFIKLLSLYTGLFIISFKLIQLLKTRFWLLAGAALIFRMVYIASLPNLSQDVYRFIWDGRLLTEGINPYGYTPEDLMDKASVPIAQAGRLMKAMGGLSASHYTSYPPVNQWLFAAAAWTSPNNILFNIIGLRLFILLADTGILLIGRRLLRSLNLPVHRIFWVLLNPFTIIEGSGNLHFESVMCFFILLSLYLLQKKSWRRAAVSLGTAISVKLLPLMFLPLFLRYFKTREPSLPQAAISDKKKKSRGLGLFHNIAWGKLLIFYIICLSTIALSVLPFLYGDSFSNFTSSIALWFQEFEFNASVYYILRWIGYQIKGYNTIATLGKILPVICSLFIIMLALWRKNRSLPSLITSSLFSVSFYFLLSTTVHPWYLATPLLLCIFTRYRFPVVWSGVVVLSYAAYGNAAFRENLYLISLEYLLVFGYFIYEYFYLKKDYALASTRD